MLTQTVTVDGQPQVTRYEYDGYGRLMKETDALGHETSYTYDRPGNRLDADDDADDRRPAVETLVTRATSTTRAAGS